MPRNFSSESNINFLLRATRAASGRIRGGLLRFLGAFAHSSGKNLYFGSGLRMINSKNIKFGDNCSFGVMARIECHSSGELDAGNKPIIRIGDNTSFGDYFHAGASVGLEIGSGVLGGSNILIVDHSHGKPKEDMKNKNPQLPRLRNITSKGPILIEDNVWIADNCVILGGSKIGIGAIISTGSIVSGEVEPFSIYKN